VRAVGGVRRLPSLPLLRRPSGRSRRSAHTLPRRQGDVRLRALRERPHRGPRALREPGRRRRHAPHAGHAQPLPGLRRRRVRTRRLPRDVPGRPRAGPQSGRVLLAEAGFKDASIGAAELRARLTVVLAAMTRCLEIEPEHRACQLWHASSRGFLARGSWNPLNLRLPLQLMSEFQSARGGAAPAVITRTAPPPAVRCRCCSKWPRLAGGNPTTGLQLIKEAKTAPAFGCRLANGLILAEALGRTGDLPAARSELKAIVRRRVAGLRLRSLRECPGPRGGRALPGAPRHRPRHRPRLGRRLPPPVAGCSRRPICVVARVPATTVDLALTSALASSRLASRPF